MSCNGRTDSIKYQSFNQTYTTESLQTTITYQSSRDALENNIDATTGAFTPGKWRCGQQYEYGRLDNIHLHTDQGPFWNVDLQFNQPLSAGVILSMGDNDKATENSLTVRMLSLPIESHPNYKKIWNNYIIALGEYYDILYGHPDMYAELDIEGAAELVSDSSGSIRWVKSDSQIPTQPETVTRIDPTTHLVISQQPEYWKIVDVPTKPGVETYDFPTYEVVENAKHKDRNNATWSLLAKNGKLRFPQYGDFGIESYFFSGADGLTATVSGHWLCEGAGINFDGKYYIANCTYLFSPDPMGWDQEMYEVASGGYYKSGSKQNPNSIFDGHGNTQGNVTNPIIPNGGN